MRRVWRNLGRAKQTGAKETGDSVLENELAAERESEWIDEDEARSVRRATARA